VHHLFDNCGWFLIRGKVDGNSQQLLFQVDVFFLPLPNAPPTDAFMDSTSLRRPAGQESSIKATKGPLMMPSHTPCLGVSV